MAESPIEFIPLEIKAEDKDETVLNLNWISGGEDICDDITKNMNKLQVQSSKDKMEGDKIKMEGEKNKMEGEKIKMEGDKANYKKQIAIGFAAAREENRDLKTQIDILTKKNEYLNRCNKKKEKDYKELLNDHYENVIKIQELR